MKNKVVQGGLLAFTARDGLVVKENTERTIGAFN